MEAAAWRAVARIEQSAVSNQLSAISSQQLSITKGNQQLAISNQLSAISSQQLSTFWLSAEC
jgi:hypothetical protein